MVTLDENTTKYPGSKKFIKGTAATTPFVLRETLIGGQLVQVKVYTEPTILPNFDDDIYTILTTPWMQTQSQE